MSNDNDYLCADCGHHQDALNRHCDSCNSPRMVTKEFAIKHFGEDYMRCFDNTDAGKTYRYFGK